AVRLRVEAFVEPNHPGRQRIGLPLDSSHAEADLRQIVGRRDEAGGGSPNRLQLADDRTQEQREGDEEGRCSNHRDHRQQDQGVHRVASPPSTQSGHPGHCAAWVPMAPVAATMPFADVRISAATWFVVSSRAIWMVLFATCWPMVQMVDTPSRTFRAARRTRVSSTATKTSTTA